MFPQTNFGQNVCAFTSKNALEVYHLQNKLRKKEIQILHVISSQELIKC